jgi:hypothetical protein
VSFTAEIAKWPSGAFARIYAHQNGTERDVFSDNRSEHSLGSLVFGDGALEAFLARFRVREPLRFEDEMKCDRQGNVLTQVEGGDK